MKALHIIEVLASPYQQTSSSAVPAAACQRCHCFVAQCSIDSVFLTTFFNIGIFTLSHSFVTSQDFYAFVVVKIRNYSD